jgi:tetratricopeptide (TPR) repeat protein
MKQAEAEVSDLLSLDVNMLDVEETEQIQRLWGKILAAQGNLIDAVRILQGSLGQLERVQPYEKGCTLLALAEVLAQLGGRSEEARNHAEQARKIFARLGAKLDLQEANQLLARL